MKVQCAPGYAIGIPIVTEEKSAGGLVLQNIKDDFGRARLIVVGESAYTDSGKRVPFPFSEGDVVAFTGGKEIRIDGHNAVVLYYKNVVCALWEEEQEEEDSRQLRFV